MKALFKVSVILFLSTSLASYSSLADNISGGSKLEKSNVDPLMGIKNFRSLSPILASAGMPSTKDLTLLKQNHYQHIINLIPGDFSEEQQQVRSLGMSFEQIAVDWHEPKLTDFEKFVELMNKYQQDKVLVHCRLNYRASAFVYLYQTIQLNIDEGIAKDEMLSVWQPEGIWLDYINSVKQHYLIKQ